MKKMPIPDPALSKILIRVEAEKADGYLKEIFSKLAFDATCFKDIRLMQVSTTNIL